MDLATFGFKFLYIIEFIYGSMPKKQQTLTNDKSRSLLYYVTFKHTVLYVEQGLTDLSVWRLKLKLLQDVFFLIHTSKMVTFSRGILSCK